MTRTQRWSRVHEMAAYRVGKALKQGDNRCAGVRSEYASLTENPFLSLFYERYKDDFHLNVKRESCPTPEGASKGLSKAKIRNRNRNKNKIKIFGAWLRHPPDGGSSDEAPSEKPKSSYPEEFELAWRDTQSAQEAIARSMRSKPGLPELNQAQQRRSLPMVFDDMRITSLLPENSTLST